jgi:hypothetical protein
VRAASLFLRFLQSVAEVCDFVCQDVTYRLVDRIDTPRDLTSASDIKRERSRLAVADTAFSDRLIELPHVGCQRDELGVLGFELQKFIANPSVWRTERFCPTAGGIEVDEVRDPEVSTELQEGFDFLKVVVHEHGDHVDSMTAVRTIAVEQFKRFDGTIPRTDTPPLGIVFGRISVVDGNRDLLQTRPQDLFCHGFVHEPAVRNEDWKMAGPIEHGDYLIEIFADERLSPAEGDHHGARAVEFLADPLNLLHRQFIGGIVRLLPEVTDLAAKIAPISHLQITMDESAMEETQT